MAFPPNRKLNKALGTGLDSTLYILYIKELDYCIVYLKSYDTVERLHTVIQ